jgi:hypothetical protein
MLYDGIRNICYVVYYLLIEGLLFTLNLYKDETNNFNLFFYYINVCVSFI